MSDEQQNNTPPAPVTPPAATPAVQPEVRAEGTPATGLPRGDRPSREGRNRNRRRGRDRKGGPRPEGQREERGDPRRQLPDAPRGPQVQFARTLNTGMPRRDPLKEWISKVKGAEGVLVPLGVHGVKEVERDPVWVEAIAGLPKAVQLMEQAPVDGIVSLREGFARLLTREGLPVTDNEMFVTQGVGHSLKLLALGLIDPGSTVLVEPLTRARAIHAFKSAGARVEVARSDADGIAPGGLDRRLQAGDIRFVYLNPTYREPDDAVLFDRRRQEIAEVCARRGVILVEDDPYRLVFYGAPPPRPIPPPPGLMKIHLVDLEMLVSPTLPVAGMALPGPIKERLVRYMETVGASAGRIPQEIAARLLNHAGWNVYLDRLRVMLRKRREAWLQGIEGWLKELVEYHAPRGGHFLWLKLRSGRPTHQLADVALEHRIGIWPGELFDPEFGESPYFAVSMMDLAPEEVPDAVNRLKAAIEKLDTLPRPRPRPKQPLPPPRPPQKPQPPREAKPQGGPPSQQGQVPGGPRPEGQREGRRHRRKKPRVPNAPWAGTEGEEAEGPVRELKVVGPLPAVPPVTPAASEPKTGE